MQTFLRIFKFFNYCKNFLIFFLFNLFLINYNLIAQNNNKQFDTIYITGIVRDAITKNPINNAQIYTIKYESGIITTDSNGFFKLKVYIPDEILHVSAYDYNPREIAIKGVKNILIDLYSDKFKNYYYNSEEILGTQRRIFSIIAKNEINKLDNYSSITIDEVIQNNLGGDIRSINKSGLSGIGYTYFMRGFNSINLNAQPLFVVDGVIWNNLYGVNSLHDNFFFNTLANIDPIDIENITVIKDNTSLYGIKGGNGVVLIKTRRGEGMVTKIDFSATAGIIDIPATIPVMNAEQFRIYLTDMLGTMNLTQEEIENMKFLQDDPSSSSYLKYHNNTDWKKEVYRTGTIQKYNISVNGGDQKALYYFSAGITNISDVIKNVNMERLNTRFNGDFSFTDFINMLLNIGFTNIDRNILDDGVNYYTSPSFLSLIKSPFLNPYSYTYEGTLTTDLEDSDDFGVGNPVGIIRNSLNTTKQYRLNIGLKPSLRLAKNINLSNQFEYVLHKVKETYYRPILGSVAIYIPGYGYSENVFKAQQIRNYSLNNDLNLRFSYNLMNKHKIEAVTGIRYIANFLESYYGEGHNSGSDQKKNLLNEEINKSTNGEDIEIKNLVNYYSLTYSFKNRYFINYSLSIDYSSNIGNEIDGSLRIFGKCWGIFPSINFGWLISSENFMKEVEFIDMLKLRMSLSYAGNDNLKPYASLPYLGSVRYIDRANGLIIKNIGNSKLKWETNEKFNIGLDANLFNDKLYLMVDIFKNVTRDLIWQRKLPYITGNGYYLENCGSISNTGMELTSLFKLINKNFIKCEIGANIGTYKSKVISLPENAMITKIYDGEIITSIGSPVALFYGYKTKGIFCTEAEAEKAFLKVIDKDGKERLLHAGDVYFVDVNNDGIINDNDKQVIGDPNPDFYGSFYSNIIFKRITINVIFNFSYGNEIYNYLRSELESGGANFMIINQSTAMLDRWYYDGQKTYQPRISYGDPAGNSRFSDRWIEDGSYIKLKKILIDYKLPLKNNIVRGINIWISLNNLFTLTKYLGPDPEVSVGNDFLIQGIDAGLLPSSRSFNLGIKLNL